MNDPYKYRNQLVRAKKEMYPDREAIHMGYESFEQLEELALKEAEANQPAALKLAKTAYQKARELLSSEEQKLASETAKDRERAALFSTLPKEEHQLRELLEDLESIPGKRNEAEAFIVKQLVDPDDSPRGWSTYDNAFATLLNLPIKEKFLPLAINAKREKIKSIKERIQQLS